MARARSTVRSAIVVDRHGKKQRRTSRWFAVGFATVLMFLAYTMFIFGFASASEGEPVFAGGLIGIATGLVPGVFFAAATLSQRERAVRASLLATLIWFLVAAPIAIFDIPTGMVAGFGAGGMVTIRRPGSRVTGYRAAAVGMCVAYTFVVQRIVPEAGLMVGGVTPLVAIALADVVWEREAEALADAGELANP